MQKILITGATGFIGSYIARTILDSGRYQVFALCREGSDFSLLGNAKEQIHWFKAGLDDLYDLRSPCTEVDAVIHCAGLVTFNRYQWKNLVATNVQGTARVVNWCIDHSVDRLIHLSSVSALGKPRNLELIDETAVWQENPLSSRYARSKYLGELEIFRGIAEGLRASVVYPSFVLGASWWNSGPISMIKHIHKGLKYYPKGTNGVVDVRDVSTLVLRLLQMDSSPDRIICSASNISLYTLAGKIAQFLDVAPPDRQLGSLIRGFAAVLDPFLSIWQSSPMLSREQLFLADIPFKYDNKRSMKISGFEYRPVDQTIRETCLSYLSSVKMGRKFGILSI